MTSKLADPADTTLVQAEHTVRPALLFENRLEARPKHQDVGRSPHTRSAYEARHFQEYVGESSHNRDIRACD